MMDANAFVVLAAEVVHQNRSSVVALTILFWEWIIALEGEVKFIWQSASAKTRATYIVARYFAMGYMVINFTLSILWTSKVALSQSTCTRWYIQHITAFCIQYIASHVTLSKKIFILYKGRKMGMLHGFFHLTEILCGVLSSRGTVIALKFDAACNAHEVPNDVFLFLGMFVAGQLFIWVLLLREIWKPNGRGSPRVTFRTRLHRLWNDGDGKAAWGICMVGFMATTYQAFVTQHVRPVYIFAWPISLISIGTCRYIISMERDACTQTSLLPPGRKEKESLTQLPEVQVSTTTHHHIRSSDDIPLHVVPDTKLANYAGSMNGVTRPSSSIYTQSFSRSSTEIFNWKHPSGLHSFSSITSDQRSLEVMSVRTGTGTDCTSQTTCNSGRRRTSLESRQTDDTEITVPSFRTANSIDIEIGSLQHSSSLDSEELRDFWNDAWNSDPLN